jgi:cytochrome c-type biogenesis protein CcmH
VKRAPALLAAAALCVSTLALAVDSQPPIPDPALQARYLELTHELRCVQCQNESIADSPVEIAAQLRREVRESLIAGQTDEQILDTMVSRYSEFILFKPRWSAKTALLWLAPLLLLLGGGVVALRILSRRRALLDTDESRVEDEANA